MRKAFFYVTVFVALGFHSPAIQAQEELPPPVAIVREFLALTPEQTEALIASIQTRDAAVRPIAETLKGVHEQFRELIETTDPDAAAVGRLIVQIYDGQEQIQEIARQAATTFESTLTDEQRQKLQLIRAAEQVAPALHAFKAIGLI